MVIIEAVKCISGIVSDIRNNPRPRPMSKLNIGPAKDPARAISPKPSLASFEFKDKSHTLLPKARRVIPRKDSGKFNTTPIIFNKSIRLVAVNHTHSIDIINEYKQKIRTRDGGFDLVVQNKKKTDVRDKIKRDKKKNDTSWRRSVNLKKKIMHKNDVKGEITNINFDQYSSLISGIVIFLIIEIGTTKDKWKTLEGIVFLSKATSSDKKYSLFIS